MIATEELKDASEEDMRLIAERLEFENPGWLIMYGVYSRQFVAFPRFRALRRTVVTAIYPSALPGRLRQAESQAGYAPGEAPQAPHGK
jgi:hypothetical protein